MSSLYKSPGVHIESAGDRYIPLERVEMGVTCFLGVTDKGPSNEPTRIGSYEQYAKTFSYCSNDPMRVGSLRGPPGVTPRKQVTPVCTRSSGM